MFLTNTQNQNQAFLQIRRNWRALKEALVCELTTITNIAGEKPSNLKLVKNCWQNVIKQKKLHICSGNQILETINMKIRK